jgi:hypothetical protein
MTKKKNSFICGRHIEEKNIVRGFSFFCYFRSNHFQREIFRYLHSNYL